MKQDNRKAVVIFCGLGILPVIWLGLLMAPAMKSGLPAILLRFPDAMNHPFDIVFRLSSFFYVPTVLAWVFSSHPGTTTAGARSMALPNGAMYIR